jgi:hypothetical protein
MAVASTQTFATHRKFVPMYHFVASFLLLLNMGYAIWALVKGLNFANAVGLTTAFALLLLFFYARGFALAVQDRVIRLEERLRMARLLPDDLQPRIDGFTAAQMVGLRFASDAELPGLARRVIDEGIGDREAIKKLITDWRGDECRA